MSKGVSYLNVQMMGELMSLLLMAVALGLDAFSVSLGLGMQWLRLKRIAMIGIVFGLFHIALPFIGIMIGKVLSTQIGELTAFIGGLLLIAIGAQMFFDAFNNGKKKAIQPIGFGLILLALSVSVDSFSVGLSLGLSGVKTALAIITFGVMSTILTWAGMLVGRKVTGFLGAYSELLGGSILVTFGLKILFG